jgi:hypothetical protein
MRNPDKVDVGVPVLHIEEGPVPPRGGHKNPKPNTETELTGTETELTETELTETNFGWQL